MDIFPESFQKKQNNNEAGIHPKPPDEHEFNPLSLSMQTTGGQQSLPNRLGYCHTLHKNAILPSLTCQRLNVTPRLQIATECPELHSNEPESV
jgi:hypothetical protein